MDYDITTSPTKSERQQPVSDSDRSPNSPTRRQQWLTLAAVSLGVFVTALDNTVVNVALPTIQQDLDLGLGGLAWIVNGYILSSAVLLLTAGRLADAYGRRRVFLIGLGAFTGASLLAGLAPSAGALIAARILQGVGAALLTPPTLAIINHTFRDGRARGTAVGIWGAYMCIYGMEGPGGYQFVGRTLQVYNRFRSTTRFEAGTPWLLRFFDQIRFYPVSAAELLEMREAFPYGKVDVEIEPGTFKLRDYEQFLSQNRESIASFKAQQQSAFEAERLRCAVSTRAG